MTRLRRYILEEEEEEYFEYYWDKIENDCKPFLKDLRSCKTFLYRGLEDSSKMISRRKVRKDRWPRNTPQEMHDYMNALFKKKFGWKVRSEGLFTFNKADTGFYGKSYVVLPVGPYKAVWSPIVNDLLVCLHLGKFYSIAHNHGIDFKKIREIRNVVKLEKRIDKDTGINLDPYLLYNDIFNVYVQVRDGFPEDNIEKFLSVYKGMLDDVIRGYKETSLKSVPRTVVRREIVVKCDYYYAIDSNIKKLIMDKL